MSKKACLDDITASTIADLPVFQDVISGQTYTVDPSRADSWLSIKGLRPEGDTITGMQYMFEFTKKTLVYHYQMNTISSGGESHTYRGIAGGSGKAKAKSGVIIDFRFKKLFAGGSFSDPNSDQESIVAVDVPGRQGLNLSEIIRSEVPTTRLNYYNSSVGETMPGTTSNRAELATYGLDQVFPVGWWQSDLWSSRLSFFS